ncbi:flagellum-specific ATP synthase FliI [Pacificimonas flava]|uniref:Flagellum-specific ATP synthase n=3 Tax=Sphingosinicellaceae TaxID=2820280 RepID=A0A219BA94_9SPHN|nr:flagellar protein export ATPase FliI [Pacificimonas aurantium]OWV34708.1 flagellum-specific ATP synthase FliI [Pacificimonas flava]
MERALRDLPLDERAGRVVAVRGPLIEVEGLEGAARIGSQLRIDSGEGEVDAEVIGLDHGTAMCMPFQHVIGLGTGGRARFAGRRQVIRPSQGWLGRVVDGLGRPADNGGPLVAGLSGREATAAPPAAVDRAPVGERVTTGVRALDMFTPLCLGQRLGLFAGSGVGKSVLLSMLARGTDCDVAVIGMIGERGREVREFIENDLGEEGLARSVVVVATSDEPALMRRQAAWTTLAIAEHFRDEGLNVLCLMDSTTRFAMAQREIGLALGEPPATKGYTPTVFAELPRLLERAGPGHVGAGTITGLFTVLVDGGDHDEPIADAVRGILDGHVVMSRKIAERGRYPAIDLLKSVSRTLPRALPGELNDVRRAALQYLSVYADMEEMIRLGAYKPGSNQAVDDAVARVPAIEALLSQGPHDVGSFQEDFAALAGILAGEIPDQGADQ